MTTLFDGTTISATTSGSPLIWLDEEHLLVKRYDAEGGYSYEGTYVVDAQGTELGRSPFDLPDSRLTAVRNGALVFSRVYGRLYEATGSNTIPVLDVEGFGDANDQHVIYAPRAGASAGALQVRSY